MGDGAPEIRLHATAIGYGPSCALIRGPSGAGKSDLALRCLALTLPGIAPDTPYLVADDQVVVRRHGETLIAEPPAILAGLMEVRGLGILSIPHRAMAPVVVLVDLVGPAAVERLPDPWPQDTLLGLVRPVLRLCAFEASTPHKLILALAQCPWETRS